MNTGWAPKPLSRPESDGLLFAMVESPTLVKGLSPMQRQREADGSGHTRTGSTALRPPDPTLVFPDSLLSKGSLVEKYDERPKMPKMDPEDPMMVVKSYLASKKPEPAEAPVDKSVEKMMAAIQDVLGRTGAK